MGELRPANVMDLAGYAGVVIGTLSDSSLWWLIALIGLGLIFLSGWLCDQQQEQMEDDRGRG